MTLPCQRPLATESPKLVINIKSKNAYIVHILGKRWQVRFHALCFTNCKIYQIQRLIFLFILLFRKRYSRVTLNITRPMAEQPFENIKLQLDLKKKRLKKFFVCDLEELLSVCLQVKTQLENPTQFHVTENQKRQIHLFLHNSGKVTTAQSMPALTTQMPGANMVPTTVSGSAPVDPDSPLSMGLSSATNSISDFNEVWGRAVSLLYTVFQVWTVISLEYAGVFLGFFCKQ